MADPKDLSLATENLIVLAFDLLDAEILRAPNELKKALLSPQVQDSIRATLLQFAKTKMGPQTSSVSNADGQKLLTDLGTGVAGGMSQALLDQIKASPEYKKLEAGVKAFEGAAKSSALGVWVDQNKKVVYVIGAVLLAGGLAGATALYVTKTGGPALNTVIDPIKGKDVEFLKVGVLSLKGGLWDFKPDAQLLGGRVSAAMKWEKVAVELKFGVLAKGAQVQEWDGSTVVKSGPVSLSASAGGMPQLGKVNFSLRLGYDGVVENGKLNVGIGATYRVDSTAKTDSVSANVNATYTTQHKTVFGFEGSAGPNKSGQVEERAMFTLTVPLP